MLLSDVHHDDVCLLWLYHVENLSIDVLAERQLVGLIDLIVVENALQVIDPLKVSQLFVVFPKFWRNSQVDFLALVVVELLNIALPVDQLYHLGLFNTGAVVWKEKLDLVS